MARHTHTIVAAAGVLMGCFGLHAARADHQPVIALPGNPQVPVVIDGVPATGALVSGDWGLYAPGRVVPEVRTGIHSGRSRVRAVRAGARLLSAHRAPPALRTPRGVRTAPADTAGTELSPVVVERIAKRACHRLSALQPADRLLARR